LRNKKLDTIFISVQKVAADLDRHQKEILDSAIAEGVKIAVLTNGVNWWFYLAFQEGAPEQRKFYAFDLLKQKPNEVASKIITLLEKNNVCSGKALNKAESMHHARQTRVIDKSMTEAWQKLLNRPPEALIQLINETFEKISGFRAEERVIEKYLAAWARGESCEEIIDLKEPVAAPAKSYKGRTIKSFKFKSHGKTVESWDRFLVALCELLASKYSHDLEKLLWHAVDNKFFFRDNPEELRLPLNIEGTNLYVETALNPDDTVKVARSVLEAFGHSGSELDITAV
jgi:hypothetical protein